MSRVFFTGNPAFVYNDAVNTLKRALGYSFPVFLGYITIGAAFGLVAADAGYPWWIALLTSVVIYTGAGQFIAVGLFAAGAGPAECALVQLLVNARHIAYGLSMRRAFRNAGPYRFYLIYALSDETFALLSSLPGGTSPRLMFLVALLNQSYWVAGTAIGALAGSLVPFNTDGLGFALTSLFIVLMLEQMLKLRRPPVFAVSAAASVLGVVFLPPRAALLGAMAVSLALPLFAPFVKARLTGKRRTALADDTEAA